jgi:hypothetical protein
MQATETVGADAPAEPTPPNVFEDTVLKLLGDLSDRMAAQEDRIAAIETAEPATPRFIDPRVNANTKAAERTRMALAATPDGVPHSQKIPMFPNGEKIPSMVMRQFKPQFGSGDIVQLDLNAVPHGRDDGRTRGELMSEKNTPNGYGEVFDAVYLSDTTAVWKYRVKFDPKVMPGSNGGLVALYESELLPA